ncbi:hypothetical protein ACTHT3_16350, partial [Neisseria sp. P0015.S004]
SLTLSHGEREQIAENLITVNFQHHYSLSHGERGQIAENPIIVDFQRHYSLSPWERVRERAKRNNLKNVV